MKKKLLSFLFTFILGMSSLGCAQKNNSIELLNASYDPTREFYKEYNECFSRYWKDKTGQEVVINQSHGGSGTQGRAVSHGLEADITTLALSYDIDKISKSGLIDDTWQERFEYNSCPYTSTIIFLVRKDNPKNIKDWNDLIRDDVSVITPNPKTSGGARWNYLAALAYALEINNGDEEKCKDFMKSLYSNVEVLDSGARSSTTSFAENGLGDVLVSWENEAYTTIDKLGSDKFEVVYPSISILAEPAVSLVDRVNEKRGTKDIAREYINYLYSDEGQKIAAENYYRPSNKEILEEYRNTFKDIKLVSVDDIFGGWKSASEKYFSDGGMFDEIYSLG